MIVHVGAGKAGSSAIQDFLGRNLRRLERLGYFVPGDNLSMRPRNGHHVDFFDRLQPIDEDKIALAHARFTRLARLCRRGGKHLIISAENLINPSDGERDFADVFAAVRDLFDVTVLVYVRRQDDYLVASWIQWQGKHNPDFRAWLARERGRLGDWDAAVRRWEEALPEADFRVRVYDRRRLAGGDVVTDFLDVLGLPPDGFERPRDPLVNRSINELAARVLVRSRHLFEHGHDHRFVDFLRDYGGQAATAPVNTGLFLSTDERRELVADYAESNERLRGRYLPELPEGGLFSHDYLEAPNLEPGTLIERELDLLWTAVFAMYAGQSRGRERRRP